MQFRDLQRQYQMLKSEVDQEIREVLVETNFISGKQVSELEEALAAYVGVKHCITCGNGTDALVLALMVWEIQAGDAVFVPDFTFFASGEAPASVGATPVFVDVEEDTFNMSAASLEKAILKVTKEGKLTPKVVIAVDLFGQPAAYAEIRKVAEKYGLWILEDGAQGFGGRIGEKMACSFGDISTTSFFPAKPLGCYGDGGAVFTDRKDWAALLKSYRIHGKGDDKYDNVRIGVNSRLDTIQAAILKVKLKALKSYELEDMDRIAGRYTEALDGIVKVPRVNKGFFSSWAQYSILLKNKEERDGLHVYLDRQGIPTAVYYPRPMSRQKAFQRMDCRKTGLRVTESLCQRVLALPIHPYMEEEEQDEVISKIKEYVTALR